MAEVPTLIAQIIHIEGPEKGKIQEISADEIIIGRHPDCQVRYPSDLKVISRKHAVITREGNRFKLTDTSANGTIVNGKREKEIFLKDGDVLAIADGGPKFSFLTKMGTAPAPPSPPQSVAPQPAAPQQPPIAPQPPPVQQPPVQPAPPVHTAPPPAPPQPQAPPPVTPQPSPVQPTTPGPPMQKVKAPLYIQYGPTLQNYDALPIIIGNQPGCDWLLEHPGVQGQQAQIWFDQGQYWVKDMTGKGLVTIQGAPVGNGMILNPESQLSLGSNGPIFKFLGNGRLAEVEAPPPPQTPQTPPSYQAPVEKKTKSMQNAMDNIAENVENIAENISKKAKNILGKYLNR